MRVKVDNKAISLEEGIYSATIESWTTREDGDDVVVDATFNVQTKDGDVPLRSRFWFSVSSRGKTATWLLPRWYKAAGVPVKKIGGFLVADDSQMAGKKVGIVVYKSTSGMMRVINEPITTERDALQVVESFLQYHSGKLAADSIWLEQEQEEKTTDRSESDDSVPF